MEHMKIAQIAPLFESVPPKLYGGTERVVSFLTEELIAKGCQVTLFASKDSQTSATLRPIVPQALRLDENHPDGLAAHIELIEAVLKEAHRFDIIHSHIDFLPFPCFRRLFVPTVHTLHGRLDFAGLERVFREYRDMPLVSISNAQRRPLPNIRFEATVHHGLPRNLFHLGNGRGGYFAFLGRACRDKGIVTAIGLAKKTKMPLKIAAKVDTNDREYFERYVEPLLDSEFVEFVGEINESQKQEFLGNATALLFPIDWPEPFGIVMIEALACGTPVIATPCGSVPEIIQHGLNGFICQDIDDLAQAMVDIGKINRLKCRLTFEQGFCSSRMADDYIELYLSLLRSRRTIFVMPNGNLTSVGVSQRSL